MVVRDDVAFPGADSSDGDLAALDENPGDSVSEVDRSGQVGADTVAEDGGAEGRVVGCSEVHAIHRASDDVSLDQRPARVGSEGDPRVCVRREHIRARDVGADQVAPSGRVDRDLDRDVGDVFPVTRFRPRKGPPTRKLSANCASIPRVFDTVAVPAASTPT